MYKRVYFGDVTNDHVRELKDINAREFLILALLAAPCCGWAFSPSPSPMYACVCDRADQARLDQQVELKANPHE